MPKPVHRRPFYVMRPYMAHERTLLELWLRDRAQTVQGEIGLRVQARGLPTQGEFEVELSGPDVTVLSTDRHGIKLLVRNPLPVGRPKSQP